MIQIDRECEAVARLFSKKSIRAKHPVYVRSENPIFRKKGSSFNLKSVREYQPFDDVRQIDWKLYGRTDRFYIKEFYEEENERFYLLVDSSASMGIYDLDVYRTFVASLACIFLKLHFSISLLSFDQRLLDTCLNVKEQKNIGRVLRFLEALRFSGRTDLLAVLRALRSRYRPTTVFLFSDLFDANLYAESFAPFRRSFLLHFYSAFEESRPEFAETEVQDPELQRKLVFSYDAPNQRRIRRLEREFLQRFEPDSRRLHYQRVERGADRVPFYWRVLENLYD
jgi:uncharacterized protein (DUF58 family)